ADLDLQRLGCGGLRAFDGGQLDHAPPAGRRTGDAEAGDRAPRALEGGDKQQFLAGATRRKPRACEVELRAQPAVRLDRDRAVARLPGLGADGINARHDAHAQVLGQPVLLARLAALARADSAGARPESGLLEMEA